MEEPGKRARTMDVRDRLSGLPDELLHRVLSFLPARDAVRTCVLAPRWRYLWVSAWHLNIDTTGFSRTKRFTRFVSNLLLRRGNVPLDTFWLHADGPHILLDKLRDTANLWIYHALRCCNVQALGIVDCDYKDCNYKNEEETDREEIPRTFYPDCYSFTSSHLKRLHLCFVSVKNRFIKQLFYGCPALEDLEMIDCDITATEFSSTTLKRLNINYVGFSYSIAKDVDIVVDMPSLVSLCIGGLAGAKPSFMNLQSLLTASISIEQGQFQFSLGCSILRAFSNVRNLEFLTPYTTKGDEFLGDDMLFCQVVFTNLITLSLGDWCLHHTCKALLYVLKKSPNLEKLTLILSTVGVLIYYPEEFLKYNMKIDPPCRGAVTPFNCTKLQKIKIICPDYDNRVGTVVAILCANLISLPEISIKPF